MIRAHDGTVYITSECFCDRYTHSPAGQPFTYATGDLERACETQADARALRATVRAMEIQNLIDLTERKKRGAKKGSRAAIEYRAIKRAA